jgi:hypothetical protein
MARTATATAGQRLTNANAIVTIEPLSMACWFNPAALDTNRVLMSVAASGNNDDFFLLFTDNQPKLTARKGNAAESGNAAATATPVTGVWQHACGTWTSSTSRACYLNGANKGTNTTSIAFGGALNRTGIFHNARADQDMVANATIAEAAIWNVVLTDEEVAALGKGYSPRLIRPTALRGYWPIFGNASPEPDFWKNGFSMTIGGTLAKASHKSGLIYPVPPSVIGF